MPYWRGQETGQSNEKLLLQSTRFPLLTHFKHTYCEIAVTTLVTLDVINGKRYYLFMIRSFASRETERLFKRQFSRKLPHNIQRRARMKLEILDAAESLEDLRIPPSNRLEKLSGDRQGQYSIRINDQWRICFEWHDGDAKEVEIADYH